MERGFKWNLKEGMVKKKKKSISSEAESPNDDLEKFAFFS